MVQIVISMHKAQSKIRNGWVVSILVRKMDLFVWSVCVSVYLRVRIACGIVPKHEIHFTQGPCNSHAIQVCCCCCVFGGNVRRRK